MQALVNPGSSSIVLVLALVKFVIDILDSSLEVELISKLSIFLLVRLLTDLYNTIILIDALDSSLVAYLPCWF